jgi:serine/threonine-protein kinase RsbW
MFDTTPMTTDWLSLELHTIDDMRYALGGLIAELRRCGYSDKEQFGIRLTLEEAIVNAIRHGHGGDTSKCVRFRYRLDDQSFAAEIEDEGPGFNPAALPDPLAPENLELPGGRGVFLMRHYMTTVSFNSIGNRVMLCKNRDVTPPGETNVMTEQ